MIIMISDLLFVGRSFHMFCFLEHSHVKSEKIKKCFLNIKNQLNEKNSHIYPVHDLLYK